MLKLFEVKVTYIYFYITGVVDLIGAVEDEVVVEVSEVADKDLLAMVVIILEACLMNLQVDLIVETEITEAVIQVIISSEKYFLYHIWDYVHNSYYLLSLYLKFISLFSYN